MRVIHIPEDLKLEKTDAIQIFEHRSTKAVERQQIILNQNAFSFLTDGTKEVVSANTSIAIDPSRFLVMKSGHCLMTERLARGKTYRSVMLIFSTEALLKFIRKARLPKVQAPEQTVFSFANDVFVQNFVDSLISISMLSQPMQAKLLEVKLEEIMLYLSEVHGAGFLHALAANSDSATQKLVRTVESNQLSKLSIKELAFLCDMSVSTFKREFSKQFATSPIKWFQQKRLEYAHHLLQQEHRKPSEVYYEVGYENLSSFIQAYKLRYKTTPRQHHKS
ncbi:MAG: helix-turn-helix transcriptional regulator [Bacteroidetes bacterium]|nr:helix-turn-helix transcriptional regulator [Bacteroidota bacterium]